MPIATINTAGVQYVRDHLANFPRPDRAASQALGEWAARNGVDVPLDQVDVVTLHYRPDGARGYQAVITQRLSLTQAVLSNWQGESNNDALGALFSAPWAGSFPDGPLTIVERLEPLGALDNSAPFLVFNGLFRRAEPARYDRSTHLQISAEGLQQFIGTLDFSTRYKTQLDHYWQNHFHSHRLSTKLNFIAACNKQVEQGSLSDDARKLAWRVAGLMPRGRKLRVSTLSVYGYATTDLLFINDAITDLTLLYIPGNSSPLLEFTSTLECKDWFGHQCQDPAKRNALKHHFSLADGPDGLGFSGVDTALAGIGEYPAIHRFSSDRPGFTTDGRWSARDYVNYRPRKYNVLLTEDVFQTLTERQRTRSYADADFIITSDSEVSKAKWRDFLNSALSLLLPLTFVIPGLVPLLAVGGLAQFGLGLDRAINGKTLQDKAEGVDDIVYGLFNAVPLATEALAKVGEVFQVKRAGFILPSRINEQLGYPLSPVDPPRLPEQKVGAYFHQPEPIAALEDGSSLSHPVSRVPQYNGKPDLLRALTIVNGNELVELDLIYDMELDLFLDQSQLNEVEPTYYQATAGDFDVKPANPSSRPVTDQMRTLSLRALGVDLPIPVQLPAPAQGALPIPKTIFSLWVGDRVINPELVQNLARNARRLKISQYRYSLLLSKANPEAYAQNLRLLTEQAPELVVETLEEQAYFKEFEQSKYYAQYQAALDGNGGVACNFASASDVLRYPMLHQRGGLYMDVDDQLLTAGNLRLGCIGASGGCAAEAIDQVELVTHDRGLLVQPAMSNEELGMNHQYNTSMIGSHSGNPTLLAISEEMHARYQADLEFYHSRPSKVQDPQAFYAYARRLSELTGPGLFTDIVDRLLPELYRLRQLRKLYGMPRTGSWLYVDIDAWKTAERELVPLSRFALVGSQNSWVHT